MPILGLLSYVIENWDAKKHKQTAIFGSKSYRFAYNSKTTWRVKRKFRYHVGAYECFMQAELGAPSFVTKILQAGNSKKVDEFEPMYLGNYQY